MMYFEAFNIVGKSMHFLGCNLNCLLALHQDDQIFT